MPTANLLRAFTRLTTNPAPLYHRFQTQMATPPRAYHNENHIAAVLTQLDTWTNHRPTLPLLTAALYHDIHYDPTRQDNELQSAVFCHQELIAIGIPTIDIIQTVNLILATAYHRPHHQNPDEVLLIDADLYILGSPPAEYQTYTNAIRQEYSHVADDSWRTGRPAVLKHFLERDQIYHGTWQGHHEHEAQARHNLEAEIASLT